MADFWGNITNAFGKAWGDVTGNIGNEWNSGNGAWAGIDTVLSPAELAVAGVGNLINPNPGSSPVDKAVNSLIPGGVSINAGGYDSNTGGYVGNAPAATQAPFDDTQPTNAMANQSDSMSNFAPTNMGGMLPPTIPPSNKLGETPINISNTQPQPVPQVGISPIYDPATNTGLSNMNNGRSDQDPAPLTTYVPGQNPVGTTINGVVQDHASPPPPSPGTTTDTNHHYNLNDGLALAGGVAGVATSLLNGKTEADAQNKAAQTIADSAQKDRDMQQGMFDKIQATQKPFQDAAYGTDGKGGALSQLQGFDATHPMGNFQESPDYQFRLSEGLKALRNTAGANGSLGSGETMIAANNYAQGAASQEYNNWWNRQNTTIGQQRAGLQSLAGMGQTAVGQTSQAGQNFANAYGNATMAQGNALAGGITGAANANASSYQNAATAGINSAQSYINNSQQQDQYNALLKAISRNRS